LLSRFRQKKKVCLKLFKCQYEVSTENPITTFCLKTIRLQVHVTIPVRDPSLSLVLFCHGPEGSGPTIHHSLGYYILGNRNFGIFEIYDAHTISLTQLHLPPTGSNAKYDGHWYIEPTIPVPGFRKQLTNFLQENG